MLKVYKYKIEPDAYFEFELDLPLGAKILKIDEQFDRPYLWALVNPDNKIERRRFRLAGTGHPIDESKKYNFINTFQMMEGNLIYHVFEILEN